MESEIAKIDDRLYQASRGQRNTDNWCYAGINLSAPEGMDYDTWIEEAMQDASGVMIILRMEIGLLKDVIDEQNIELNDLIRENKQLRRLVPINKPLL